METRKQSVAATLIVTAAIVLTSLMLAPAAAAEGKRVAQRSSGAGAVYGVVFNDWDQNGERDVQEPTLPDAEIKLFDLNGDVVATAVTGFDGAFRFENVTPGGYVLAETDPLGYSTLGQNEATIVVRDGETTEASFGDVLLLTLTEPTPEPATIEVAVR